MNILLVCANPRGSDPLRTAEEDRTLRESILLSPHRDRIHIETLNAATIDDLRRALLRTPFDVVHFSGHGTHTGLVFEDTAGRMMVPSSSALADLLARRAVKTVLLNACYSLSVGRLTAIGSDFTIATTGPISDPAAIEFTRGFYDAIGAGYAVSEAFQEGLSCAKLKGLQIDSVLLKSGEEYVAPEASLNNEPQPERSGNSPRTLLGIAIDTSGSMQASIRNRSGANVSRFQSVQESLAEIGNQVRNEVSRRHDGDGECLAVFIYAFGMRVGSGVADLISLWRATQRIDLTKEIETRKRRYEATARQQAASYGGLADLARRYGFGGVVDSIADAAKDSVRERIVGEIGDQVLREATAIGDSNLSAHELAEMFDTTPSGKDGRMIEHVLFGLTPMNAAANEIRARFQRTSAKEYGQRTLLVISDGEPTDGDPSSVFTAVKKDGVTIISCYVTDEDIAEPRVLTKAPLASWTKGARLMWESASEIDENSPFARYLLSEGWSLETGARLFVQVNHSDVLQEFIRIAGSHFTSESTELLPRGR